MQKFILVLLFFTCIYPVFSQEYKFGSVPDTGNPASRIIYKVIENINSNNPDYHSFSYTENNTMYFKISPDTCSDRDKLSLILDSLEIDTLNRGQKKPGQSQNFFSFKTAREIYHQSQAEKYEKFASTYTSGIPDPIFIHIITQIQSFSFYNDYLGLLDKKYITPFTYSTALKYDFLLEKTIPNTSNDTLFIISFRPKKNESFDYLEGLMVVNSNNYAIQNIVANSDISEPNLRFSIEQQFRYIDNKRWFPDKLNAFIVFKNPKDAQSQERCMSVAGRRITANIIIDPKVPAMIPSDTLPEFPRKYSKQDTASSPSIPFFADRLTDKQRMLLLEFMIYGHIPIGGINLEIKRIINYNQFEGIKLGMGLSTNPKVFSFASLGGFFTYGLRDKNWKYQGSLQLFPKWYSDTKLTFRYAKNVTETGGTSFIDENLLNSTEFLRGYYISKMDKAEEKEISFAFKPFKYLKFSVYVKQTSKIFNNYTFTLNDNTIVHGLTFSETGLQFKFAFAEKFMKTPGGEKISHGTRYPVLWFNYRRGLHEFKGDITYTKLEAKLSKTFATTFGKTLMQVKMAKINGNLPLSDLYDAQGCYDIISLDVENYFATIRPAEFYSDQYAFIFFRQTFGKLSLIKNKIQPEIALVTNVGWGNLSNPGIHGINFKTMEKGFTESGLLLTKILRLNFMNLGFGTYYRYGNYRFTKIADNFAYKVTFGYRF